MQAKRVGMIFCITPFPTISSRRPMPSGAFVSEFARPGPRRRSVGIHCWGSIGRATVTAACTLIHLGWNPATALTAVEAARGCPFPTPKSRSGGF
jgi:hypothetical protein